MDNHQLLREYVERQSEAAFAELVNRHVDLVYSTALRVLRNHALAEDVAQLVFIKLARKSGSIRAETLSSWLYRVAHDYAANAVRGEEARRSREIEAMNQTEPHTEPGQAWNQISSDLDEAMLTLSEAEQSAVLLRFFEGRNWREVGQALALSEDTVQRRVGSALEKLRAHFLRRGVTVSASVLAMAIGTNAVQAAPATLGPHLAAGALAAAGGTKGAGIVTSFIKTLLAKWQITTAVGTGVAVVGITTTVVLHHANTVNVESMRHGLVLHLGFDQEGADGRVSDESGQGNDGRATGARWTSGGRHGGAYEFKADGDQIEVPNHPSLNPANITLSAWIKSPAPDARWRYIIDKGLAPGYNLSISGGAHNNGAATIPGQAHSQILNNLCLGTARKVADGQWHQITTTYDGRQQCIYIDGQLEENMPGRQQSLSNNFNLIIGCGRYSLIQKDIGQSFRGLIDEVRVFNRALSAEETAFLFTSVDR